MGDIFTPPGVADVDIESFAKQELKEMRNAATVSHEEQEPELRDEHTIKMNILESCANNANQIYSLMSREEEAKGKHRKAYFGLFKWILIVSLCLVAVMLFLMGFGIFVLPMEVIIGIFTYIIANIFAVVYLMVKYSTDNKYLETFKTVTHKLLDYLVQDKNGVSSK